MAEDLNNQKFGPMPEQVADVSGVDRTEVGDEMAATGVNQDVAIGNILGRRDQSVVSSASAADALASQEEAMSKDVETLQGIQQASANEAKIQAPAPPSPVPVLDSGLTQRQEEATRLAKQNSDATYRALQNDIQAEINRERQKAEESQRAETGATRSQLARIGALGTTSAGIQYMNDLNVRHQQVINQLVDAGMRAKERAAIAKSEGDLKILEQEMALVRQNRKDAEDAQKAYYDNLKTVNELKKFERETAATTIGAFAEAGLTYDDIPEGYFDSMDVSSGYKSGTSAALFAVTKKDAEIQDMKDVREAEKAAIEQVSQLNSILKSVPVGEPISIGGYTYYGTMGTGDIEVDSDGNGRTLIVDQATGQVSVKELGFVGRQEDGWELQFDGNGNPWRFNRNTGSLIYAGKPSQGNSGTVGADWDDIIAEGSQGGQCGTFVRNWAGVRVGDSLASKKAVIDQTIGTAGNPVQIGDVVVTSEGGWTGHVAIVNGIVEDPDGTQRFVLTESNYKGDEKVTHTRQVTEDNPAIQGFARGELNPRLKIGTDSPSFAPTKPDVTTKVINDRLYERNQDGTWGMVVDASTPGASDKDITMGGKILRKNAEEGYDVIYELPEESKDNVVLKEIGGVWHSVNKDTNVATPIKGADGQNIGAMTGDPATDPRKIAENIMKPYSGMKLTDVKTDLKTQVEAELNRMREDAISRGDTVGILMASAGGTNISADERKSLNKAFIVVDQVKNLQTLFTDDKRLRSETKTEENKKGWDLAPITSIWRSRNPFDQKAMEIKAQLSSIVPNLARGVFGEVGVLTDKDVEIYSRTLPNLGSTEAVRKGVLSLTIKTIASSVRNQLETAAMAGADVSAFADKYMDLEVQSADLMFQALGKVVLEAPDGQKWTRDGRISQDELQEAINQGYKINFDLL